MVCRSTLLNHALALLLIAIDRHRCCRSVEEQGALVICPNAALCRQVFLFLEAQCGLLLPPNIAWNQYPFQDLNVSKKPSFCDYIYTNHSLKDFWKRLRAVHFLAQVVDFAGRLQDSNGSPLVRAAHISSSSPPPKLLPHVVVATPAGLMNATEEFPLAYGRFWSRDGIIRRSGSQWIIQHFLRVLLLAYSLDSKSLVAWTIQNSFSV